MNRLQWCAIRYALLTCLAPLGAAAQQAVTAAQQPVIAAGPALATRAALQSELAGLEAGGARDRSSAALIRWRLENGDFQPGDRVVIRVNGETQLTDTFTVTPAGEIEFQQLGAVPLHGVLRSELQQRLQVYLAKFLREPVVQVRPLIRLLVEGDVVRPGFYASAPEQPLADVITQAGGFTQGAKPLGMRVERGGQLLWSGESLRNALGSGYSLDKLSLRAGDRVFVPRRHGGETGWRIAGLLLSVPLALLTISQIK